VRALPESFAAYAWAPSTEELARRAGLDPFEIVRFDGNTRTLPHPSTRPGTIARALAEVNGYAHGGHVSLTAAVAGYAGVAPENVVLGAGADDLILLCARAFAGPADRVAIANEPTYPLYATAVRLAGAEVGDDDPVMTFCCRPNNPTGELVELPAARPLVVDEAYFEYAGETAAGLIEDGVVVLRTFSKSFALAGARVGYALAAREVAAELNARQAPLPVSTLSAALAEAALADPPDLSEEIAERERLASGLRALGLEPLPSSTNFLFVPMAEPEASAAGLLRSGVVPRILPGGLRYERPVHPGRVQERGRLLPRSDLERVPIAWQSIHRSTAGVDSGSIPALPSSSHIGGGAQTTSDPGRATTSQRSFPRTLDGAFRPLG
jgi:histidinol-phosphate aminotransferase